MPGKALALLAKMEGFTSNTPWFFSAPLEHIVFKKPETTKRVPCASSVDLDNTWRTFYWNGKDWCEIDAAPVDQRTALVASLLNDKHHRTKELQEIKQENSALKVRNMLIEHDLKRCVCKPAPQRINWMMILALIILACSLFLPRSEAVELDSNHTEQLEDEEAIS